MKAIKCDGCGKVASENDAWITFKWNTGETVFDICEDCAAKFKHWLSLNQGGCASVHDKITALNFSVRTTNILLRSGITTVEALAKLSKDELMRMRNMGRKSISEINEALESIGINRNDYLV